MWKKEETRRSSVEERKKKEETTAGGGEEGRNVPRFFAGPPLHESSVLFHIHHIQIRITSHPFSLSPSLFLLCLLLFVWYVVWCVEEERM